MSFLSVLAAIYIFLGIVSVVPIVPAMDNYVKKMYYDRGEKTGFESGLVLVIAVIVVVVIWPYYALKSK